jgi:cell division septation protein DedD
VSYQFEFGKRDSILLAAAALSLGVVLFFAGFFTDRLIARRPLPAKTLAVIRSAGEQAAAAPAAKAGPLGKSQEPPDATATALYQSGANGAAGSTTNVQLAVQVGAFAELAKAKHIVQQLQKEGFSPVIASQAGSQNQPISVVEIGPFSAWEDASRVAQVIGRSLGTRPVVRPML